MTRPIRDLLIIILSLTLFSQASEAAYKGRVLVWDPETESYRQPTPAQARALQKAKARGMTDEALQDALGIDGKTGVVTNPTTTDYKLEIGTWAGWIAGVNEVRVGPYLTLANLGTDSRWKLTADVADSFAGLSLRYNMTMLLRPTLGVGVGCPMDGTWQFYCSTSFRLW